MSTIQCATVTQAREVKAELSQRLLQTETPAGQGIVGIGIGEKRTAGRLTGLRCVTVLVRAKRPANMLSAGQLLPTEIANVRIDIQAVGRLAGGGRGDRAKPVLVGNGIQQFELHCAHTVLPPDAVLAVPLLAVNSVDCALAKPAVEDSRQPAEDYPVGQAEFDTTVCLSRACAGYAAGTVASVDTDVALMYGGKRLIFINQIIITPYGQHAFGSILSAGSLVVGRVTGEAIGMIIGGSRKIAVANHMDDVLDALGVRFCGEISRDLQARSDQPPADGFPVIDAEHYQPHLPVLAKSVWLRRASAVTPRRLAP